ARMVGHMQEGRDLLCRSHGHDADTDHEDQQDTHWYFEAHKPFHVDILYISTAPCHQHFSSVICPERFSHALSTAAYKHIPFLCSWGLCNKSTVEQVAYHGMKETDFFRRVEGGGKRL